MSISITGYQIQYKGLTKDLYEKERQLYDVVVINCRANELCGKMSYMKKIYKPNSQGTKITYQVCKNAEEWKRESARLKKEGTKLLAEMREKRKTKEAINMDGRKTDMAKYRKKVIEVEAFKYDGDLKGSDGKYYVPDWAAEAFERGVIQYASLDIDKPPVELFIDIPDQGVSVLVNVGDYIVRGEDGQIFPCKPETFEMLYELVEGGNGDAEKKNI